MRQKGMNRVKLRDRVRNACTPVALEVACWQIGMMDHRNSKRLPGLVGSISTNHGHIFLALLNGPCFVRHFAGLLRYGYVFKK